MVLFFSKLDASFVPRFAPPEGAGSMSLWSRIVAKSLISVVVGLALALTEFPASASASKISFSQQWGAECELGNGFSVVGSNVSVDPQLGWLEGSLSQFSVLQLGSPVVRWARVLRPVSVRAELIADGTNQVLHRVSSDNFYFRLADERNGASGAINDPNTYLSRNLTARITYVMDSEYGRCTVTLTSNRIGPVLTSTQYTPGAPQVVRPAGQANLAPGARAQVNLALNNVLPTEYTPEPGLTWRVEYGYADSDGAGFATCRAADGGPFTSTRLDDAKAARGEWQPRTSFNIDVPANKAGKWLCVRHQVQSLLGRATSPVTYAFIQGNNVAPRVPVITMRNAGDAFESGKEFTLTLEISGQLAPGEQLRDRLFYYNWVAGADADCSIGLNRPVQWQDLDRKTVVLGLPNNMVGKWFCAKQIIQTSSGIKSSPVVYKRVLAGAGVANPSPSLRVIPNSSVSPLPALGVIPNSSVSPSARPSTQDPVPASSLNSDPGNLPNSGSQDFNGESTQESSIIDMGSDNLEDKSQEIVGTKTETETIRGFLIGFIGGLLILVIILLLFFKRKYKR